MGWLLDLFPAWLNGIGAATFGLAGAAGLIYALFPLAPYREVARILAVASIGYAAYLSGYSSAQGACEAEQLRAELAAAELNLSIVREASADASRRATILDETLQANQERLDDYETALAARPDARCALTGDDLRGVLGKP